MIRTLESVSPAPFLPRSVSVHRGYSKHARELDAGLACLAFEQ